MSRRAAASAAETWSIAPARFDVASELGSEITIDNGLLCATPGAMEGKRHASRLHARALSPRVADALY